MLPVNKLLSGGQGLSPVLLKRAAELALDWDRRQKSRFETTDSQGRTLGVFLPRGTVLRGGDVLVAEDGSLIRVVAEPQPVLRVTPCHAHGTPFDLVRAAYHLGNRHIPLELKPDHLQLEPDHVLAAMLRQMHLDVAETIAAFEPESGAYAPGTAGHDDHRHDGPAQKRLQVDNVRRPLPEGNEESGKATSPHETGHVHGPGCGHDH